MPTIYTHIAYWSWIALFIVWIPGYFTGKRTVERPNPVRRIVAMAFIIVGFGFMFSYFSFFSNEITPQTGALGLIGVLIDLVSVAFAIWARVTLGRNWSNAIALKEGHELIKRGPYAIVRHPIYTGLLFATLGSALTVGTATSYIGLAFLLAGVLIRIHDEDALMAREFPNEHPAYRDRVKALIPFVW